MFGYVFPYKDELKVREYNMFKGYYCGLCKTIGSEFNQFIRMGLNYDITFLSILLSSIQKERPKIVSQGCIINPIKKKPVVLYNESMLYSAHMGNILTYFKLLDDWRDEKSIKSLIFMLPYRLSIKKSLYLYNDKYKEVKRCINELSKLEKLNCDIIDKSADTFGKLMEVLADPPYITDESTKRILKWLGYNLGRWIYILDAFNDMELDINKKNYNPILLQYKYAGEEIELFKDRVKEDILFSLTFTLENMGKSFELLDINYNKGILENILYLGTRKKMEKILGIGGCNIGKSI
ncbi:DUF5685 family protein [Clostridiisalibacter paucivorans]|uniref:DUF5685 family protein n=1 Tax=Clostridiisalibacter paucivorans TaxID=408753 RepID=UPI0004786B65|nr:DUF5685 family protein [Clostridiisalibacter paucivorans]